MTSDTTPASIGKSEDCSKALAGQYTCKPRLHAELLTRWEWRKSTPIKIEIGLHLLKKPTIVIAYLSVRTEKVKWPAKKRSTSDGWPVTKLIISLCTPGKLQRRRLLNQAENGSKTPGRWNGYRLGRAVINCKDNSWRLSFQQRRETSRKSPMANTAVIDLKELHIIWLWKWKALSSAAACSTRVPTFLQWCSDVISCQIRLYPALLNGSYRQHILAAR